MRKRLTAAAAVVLLIGLVVPAAASAPAVAAVPGLESGLEERVRAAGVVGVVAPDDWLVLSERDYVFELWRHAADLTEVRGAAELALTSCTSTNFFECTVYIESGIHAAKARDVASQVRDATAVTVRVKAVAL